MPSSCKKAKLGELPRLLASALRSGARRGVVCDSPLVVQAGFPTSVADLVVKNRGRLKTKAPQWLRRRRQQPHPCEAEAVASLLSGIPASTSPGPAEPKQKQGQEEQRSPTRKNAISGEVLEKSPMEEAEAAAGEAEGSASKASTRPETEKAALQARNSRGFVVMPAKVVFLVFFLAIGTQKIALGVSISAFAILFLETMGRRLMASSKPCDESKKKKSSNTAAGVAATSSSNGRIPVNRSLAAFCEKSLEFTAPVPPLEPKDRAEAEGSRRDQKGSTRNKKANKLLRKLVPKKLWGANGERGAKAEPASDSSSERASGRRGEGEEPLEEEVDGGGGDNKDEQEGGGGGGGGRDVGLKNAAFIGESVCEPAKGSLGHLVFFLIVLSGLAGGRAAAMVLTVVWCLLATSARSLWKSWKMQLHR